MTATFVPACTFEACASETIAMLCLESTTRKDQCPKERPLEESCAWDREDVRVLQKADNITETPHRPTRGHCQESDLRMNTWSLERSTVHTVASLLAIWMTGRSSSHSRRSARRTKSMTISYWTLGYGLSIPADSGKLREETNSTSEETTAWLCAVKLV
ncbi:hypothetical protein AC579_390 [Pseudocercospora musae]|uniref:Uncharacterized protein n=1 Tax=Pseudocercospora musae TaxID=113226 RepID=A0A139I339_9PEZI|nr:hypothetical protein AC579_390 [Pseudocercospora musae]